MSPTETSFKATPPADGVLVTTARLKCVEPRPSDLELLQKIFGDPAMMVFLGGALSNEFVQRRLHSWEVNWREGNSLCGIVEERQSGKHIGSASIHPSTVPDQPGAEISYLILPEYQRRGYATEISRALIEYAFQVMKLDQLLITGNPENEPSQRIAEQLGFRYLGEAEYTHPHLNNCTKHAIWVLQRVLAKS
jgi:RimJ/RimL family protein N-acetyltransferase